MFALLNCEVVWQIKETLLNYCIVWYQISLLEKLNCLWKKGELPYWLICPGPDKGWAFQESGSLLGLSGFKWDWAFLYLPRFEPAPVQVGWEIFNTFKCSTTLILLRPTLCGIFRINCRFWNKKALTQEPNKWTLQHVTWALRWNVRNAASK